ncbi:MAG: ABC transporter permease [Bacteroidales bacterium]|nr:ABC transporter permease [Bacteroidales bacterium]
MNKLIYLEYRKIASYKTFWIMLGLYALLSTLVFMGVESFINNVTTDATKNSDMKIPSITLYAFPDIWHNITFLAGYFKIFLGILMLILITNEFNYRTVRQNVINGLSRTDVILAKFLVALALSLIAMLLIFFTGLILGLINSPSLSFGSVFTDFSFIPAYFLEIITYLSLALFIGFIVKRQGLAILLLLLYSFIAEPILAYKLPNVVSNHLPLKAMGNLIQVPNTALMKLAGIEFQDYVGIDEIASCVIYIGLFVSLAYYFLKKMDL